MTAVREVPACCRWAVTSAGRRVKQGRRRDRGKGFGSGRHKGSRGRDKFWKFWGLRGNFLWFGSLY